MALKKVISGSQVLMTDDNRLYLKKKKNGVVFFKELTPTLQNEYLSCYTVPLSGRREMMQHLFLVAKDNGKIVADFIECGFMIPFLLGKELLMVNCLLTGKFKLCFSDAYVWSWFESEQCCLKIPANLPSIEVSGEEVEVLSVPGYMDILHYTYKKQDFYRCWYEHSFHDATPQAVETVLNKLTYGIDSEALGIEVKELEKAEQVAEVLDKLLQIFDKLKACDTDCAWDVLAPISQENLRDTLLKEFGKCPENLDLQQTMWKFAEQLV